MHPIYLLGLLFLFSACANTAIDYDKEVHTEKKIQSNQSKALEAQDEYKRLQAKREKEAVLTLD